MEPENDQQDYINDLISFVGKQVECHTVEIVAVGNAGRPFRSTCIAKLHKIEIHHVDYKEDENNYPGMDHKFGKKGGM